MTEIYWIEDVEPGRLAILGRPRSGDWLSEEIANLKHAGLTDVISLLENSEIRELQLEGEADLALRNGLSFEKFSIPDRGVPASIGSTRDLWNRLAAKILDGRSVGIHCRAGIGRSGLIATGVLVQLGAPELQAWQRVSAARHLQVPDTDEQRKWLNDAFSRTPADRSRR